MAKERLGAFSVFYKQKNGEEGSKRFLALFRQGAGSRKTSTALPVTNSFNVQGIGFLQVSCGSILH